MNCWIPLVVAMLGFIAFASINFGDKVETTFLVSKGKHHG